MTDTDLAQRITDLEKKHEELRAKVTEWLRLDTQRLLKIEYAMERLEARIKDLDNIEQIAYRAYEHTHPNVHKDFMAINRLVDEASLRLYYRHRDILKDHDKGAGS